PVRAVRALFVYTLRLSPSSPLFPYTTLFRSEKRILVVRDLGNPGFVVHLRYFLAFVVVDRLTENDKVLFLRDHFHIAAHLVQLSDRKSTRLNSSHVKISYAVFCLKKKNRRGR